MRRALQAMKLAGCFNGTKTSYMSKDQGKFDFSYHDPFHTICFNTFFFKFSLKIIFTMIGYFIQHWLYPSEYVFTCSACSIYCICL